MISRPKRRQVGTAGLVVRYRDGTCTHTCRRCGQWDPSPTWRAALRTARVHAGEHYAADVRYALTPGGIHAVDRPRITRRSPWRRLAAAAAVLLLAAAAFFSIADLSGRAAPAPQRPTYGQYIPRPAGPPATDQTGQWTDQPAPSSTGGGGR